MARGPRPSPFRHGKKSSRRLIPISRRRSSKAVAWVADCRCFSSMRPILGSETSSSRASIRLEATRNRLHFYSQHAFAQRRNFNPIVPPSILCNAEPFPLSAKSSPMRAPVAAADKGQCPIAKLVDAPFASRCESNDLLPNHGVSNVGTIQELIGCTRAISNATPITCTPVSSRG
jgi:hypothetical protein